MTAAQLDEKAAGAMGLAMYETLRPVAEECSARVEDVAEAQRRLGAQIDRLVAELAQLSGMTRGTGLAQYTRKLAAARTRVAAAGTTLTAVEARVARMTQDLRARHPAGHDITATTDTKQQQQPVVATAAAIGTVAPDDDDSKPKPQSAAIVAPPAPPSPTPQQQQGEDITTTTTDRP
jgi:negative regulator of sigma E activity